jgi:serine/threonine protein kinase
MPAADHYELLNKLGEGSFGEVWRARHRVTERIVAIKILHRRGDYDALVRFHREAVVLHAQLGNDHVVGLIDHSGLNDPEPYLVLEFCEHGSLRSWVTSQRPVFDVIIALTQAAKGLAGVHAAGGLHRDVKPDNLLRAKIDSYPHWRVKVADFGIACFPNPVSGSMTVSPGGTDGYKAPEIVAGADFHAGADIYSLGIVGVELLVGGFDLRGLDGCGAPASLKALLRSMTAGVAAARPTAAAVAKQLDIVAFEQIFTSSKTAAPAVEAPKRPAASPTDGAAKLFVGILGAFAVGKAMSWAFDRSQTYYDPSVGTNRGPDGKFRRL